MRVAVNCPFTQSATGTSLTGAAADFRDGMDLFRAGQYDKAILLFQGVMIDPKAGSLKADATLLVAKASMALGRLDDAERNLEFYLATYTEAADYPEAVYQEGRLLFLQDIFPGRRRLY